MEDQAITSVEEVAVAPLEEEYPSEEDLSEVVADPSVVGPLEE